MRPEEKENIFNEILAECRPLLSKVCYMYADEDNSFEDLYQEVMINLWQGLDKFRGECKRSTWIYRIAFNTCVSCKRSASRHSSTIPLDNVAECLADSGSTTANLRAMYSLISALNPIDKAIIMMWLDEKSYEEISDVSGLSKTNVATRLHRIKSKLIEMGNS